MGVTGARIVLPPPGVVLAADPLRQARDGAVRSRARGSPADARAADGRRACRDGGGRLRAGGAPRRIRGRPDVPAVRRHISRAHPGVAAVGVLRPLRLAAQLHRALLGRGDGGRRARPARARVGGRRRPRGDGPLAGRGRRGAARMGPGPAAVGDTDRGPRAAADDARHRRAAAAPGDPGARRDPPSSRRGGGRRVALPLHGGAHSRGALRRVARLRPPPLDRGRRADPRRGPGAGHGHASGT